MIFSTVAIYAVNRVSGGKRLFLAFLQQHAMNIFIQTSTKVLVEEPEKISVGKLENVSVGEHLRWRTGEHFVFHLFHVLHVTHVLQTYSMFSHPGWQDGAISAVLILS